METSLPACASEAARATCCSACEPPCARSCTQACELDCPGPNPEFPLLLFELAHAAATATATTNAMRTSDRCGCMLFSSRTIAKDEGVDRTSVVHATSARKVRRQPVAIERAVVTTQRGCRRRSPLRP